VQALRAQEAEGANMVDLDCLACHEGLAERAPVKAACDSCHQGEAIDYDLWRQSAEAPLREVEEMLAAAPAEAAAAARAEIEALRPAGPHHNVAHARATAARLKALLGNSTGDR
jgi:hypothetical protein